MRKIFQLFLCVTILFSIPAYSHAAGYIVFDPARGVYGAAVNRKTWTAAREGAFRECHRNGGRQCSAKMSFGAGHCGALAVPTRYRSGRQVTRASKRACRTRKCFGYGLARRATKSAAARAALRNCGQYRNNRSCKVIVAVCSR